MFWNSLVSLKRPSKGRDFWNCARFGRGDAAVPHCTCGGSWDYCSASFLIWQLLLLQHNWQSKEEKILEVPLLYNDSRMIPESLIFLHSMTQQRHVTGQLNLPLQLRAQCSVPSFALLHLVRHASGWAWAALALHPQAMKMRGSDLSAGLGACPNQLMLIPYR